MSNNVDKQKLGCNYVGIVITVLVFSCKNCNYAFHTTIPGLLKRVDGRLIISQKGCLDTEYKPYSCKRCGSKDFELFKCLE